MKTQFKEDFEQLITAAFEAGYYEAAWSDGAASNEIHEAYLNALEIAKKNFLEKYHDKITNSNK